MENNKFLTVDMIPKGFNYAAVDSDGWAYAFKKAPLLKTISWMCSSPDCKFVLVGKYFNNDNWRNSVITRDPLPKIPLKTLTVNDIPHGYFWAAVEPDGVAYAYIDMPNLSVDYNSWQAVEGSDYTKIGSGFDSLNWKKSLISSDENFKVFFENPTSDDIPEGFNYIAVDNSGSVYAFIRKPLLESNFWKKTGNEPFRSVGIHLGEFDWKNSLVFRVSDTKFKTLTEVDIPEGFKYAVITKAGTAVATVVAPRLTKWGWDFREGELKVIGEGYDFTDWQNSFISRGVIMESNPTKLTVVDIPEGFNYAAVDSCGTAFAYRSRPVLHNTGSYWTSDVEDSIEIEGQYDSSDWKNSLVSREATKQPNLKKLTVDDIPEGFSHAVITPIGLYVIATDVAPKCRDWGWDFSEGEFKIIGHGYGFSDWKNSLVSKNEEAKPKKLTIEDIPDGFNFAAVDYDGLAYAYVNEPSLDENEECWKAHDFWQMSSMFYLGSDYDIVDFKNSLVSKNKSDLKQLTVDEIPNGYSYAAVNSDGFAFAYKEAPVLLDGYHDVPNKIYSGCREYCKLIGYGYDVSNWENSLVSRTPEKVNKFSSFDITFLEVAEVIAKRSKSTRLKVGAVLVKDNRIIATGYNGLVSGVKPDVLEDENGVTKKEVIHAELNCIISCARNGVSCEGSTLYLTHSPCESCAALIAQSGVKKVIFKEYYRDLSGVEKLKSYGIEVM